MGGSKPSPPTIIQAPEPTRFVSKIPTADFQRAADYLARLREARKTLEGQRYLEVGTPAEMGARQAGIRAQEAASYAASLPKGSEYNAAREIAAANREQAQLDNIIKRSSATPKEAEFTTPSWAVPTSSEAADQDARNEEARVNRLIKAKSLAEKVVASGQQLIDTGADTFKTV